MGIGDIRFPGQYFDAESGMHYNRFRYYSPELGRYISADPIGQAGGVNVYAYAENNPLTYFDVLGLVSQSELDEIVDYLKRCFPWLFWGPDPTFDLDLDRPEASGTTDLVSGDVHINPTTPSSEAPDTVAHEAIHSASGLYGRIAVGLEDMYFDVPEGGEWGPMHQWIDDKGREYGDAYRRWKERGARCDEC